MKKILLIIAGVLALGAALWFAATQSRYPDYDEQGAENAEPAGEETQAYENAAFGYSLAYPAELEAIEYGMDDTVFGRRNGEAVEGFAEARIVTAAGAPGETFDDAVAAALMNLCAADGPRSSFSCTEVSSRQPFASRSGASGSILYLRGELREIATGNIEVIGKGPYFVFPLKSGATASSALVVAPPLNQSADEADSELIRGIAESIVLETGESPDGDAAARAYVREHISSLAPVPERLGGTFFVTDIEAADGAGVVEYEDGHDAYTADFTYSTGSDGSIRIDAFTVR